MTDDEEAELVTQLLIDESSRNREMYVYTVDALLKGAIIPLAIWPESNGNVREVIEGRVDYDSLPFDEVNEFHKGGLNPKQQDIILQNEGKEPLCEALEMGPCLKEKCPIYNSSLGPPVCREYKMAFRR